MKITFYDAIFFFQWGCMLASFIFSVRLMGNKKIPKYMNKFYWYSLVAALLGLYNFLYKHFNITSENVYDVLHSSLLLFHFIFLSHFIYQVVPNKKISKYIMLVFFLFLMVILFCLLTNDFSKNNSNAFAFTNLGLVLLCCLYYLQLFEEMPTINLLKEPSFWIISGIFFSMCATIPVSSLRGYLFSNIPYQLYLSMGGIGSFAYGVMHLFFVKAYLCSINQPKA